MCLVHACGAWSSLIFIINIKYSDKINNNHFILIFIESFGPAITGPAGPVATPMRGNGE